MFPKNYLRAGSFIKLWRAMIAKRLLRIPEDYDVLGYRLNSDAEGVSIKIKVPDFDMGEMRAIQ